MPVGHDSPWLYGQGNGLGFTPYGPTPSGLNLPDCRRAVCDHTTALKQSYRHNRAGLATLFISCHSELCTSCLPSLDYIHDTFRHSAFACKRPFKVVWGGDRLEVNAHVVTPDQRWAYDFVVEPYFTGSAILTDYGCYGIPVVAPAMGYVVEAHDGEPDMTPGIDSKNIQAPEGNFIVLKLETNTYLIIAHLKPGSILVKSGEKVNEGQVIGQCGNSGNTSEPHIHIHHQRQDPTIYPLNFAEGLPLYFRDHDGPPMPEGGVQNKNGNLVAIGATVQHVGK